MLTHSKHTRLFDQIHVDRFFLKDEGKQDIFQDTLHVYNQSMNQTSYSYNNTSSVGISAISKAYFLRSIRKATSRGELTILLNTEKISYFTSVTEYRSSVSFIAGKKYKW